MPVGRRVVALWPSASRTLTEPTVTLAEVAEQALVIPSRPHPLRMRLEAALACANCG